jgi:arylsulfatase
MKTWPREDKVMFKSRWKVSFKTIKGNLFTGQVESTTAPIVTNLRQDPWERYQVESINYGKWWGEKLWTMVPAVQIVGGFIETSKEYPPSQENGGLTVSKGANRGGK